MTLKDLFLQSTARFACYPALTMRIGYRTLTLTYADVKCRALSVALLLEQEGVGKGDCVLLCAPNSPLWVCVFWGCVLRGVVVVPLATQSTQAIIDKIAHQVSPKLFFKSQHVLFVVHGVKALVLEQLTDAAFGAQTPTLPVLSPSDVVEIMYTSGTTGDPKGVVLTHANIMSNVTALSQTLALKGTREHLLSILPLSHLFEQTIGMILPLSVGAHIVYAHSHGAIRELMQQYRITKLVLVPEFLKLMASRLQAELDERFGRRLTGALASLAKRVRPKPLQRLLFWPVHRLLGGRLGIIACGGAPLDPELEQWWETLGFCVLQGYGLTETAPVVTLNTPTMKRHGSVGKPLPGVQLRLDAEGQLEVKGPNVFTGYFRNEAKTRESFTADGWFKTEDMGYQDADGFWHVQGRKKYMIKGPGAQNIFPEDIEAVLNTIAGVRDSCVIGVTTPSGMMEIHAVLLLEPGAQDSEGVVTLANEQLATYQHITGWSVWPEQDFVRTPTQKIKKEPVIAWVTARGAAAVPVAPAPATPLSTLLAEIAGVSASTISPQTRLVSDLKIDSLMRIELVTLVEERRGVLIDERLITSKTIVADLETIIAAAKPATKMPRVKRWQLSWWARGMRVLGGWLAVGLARMVFKLRVQGREHLASSALPVVIMPNHVSLIDGLLVVAALPASLRACVSFAAAYDVLYQEFWWARPLAELFFNAFPFPRKEHEHVATGLLNIGTMLDAGYSVVIFPEGRVSETGALQLLKRGTGLIAVEMDCAVVPVKLVGVNHLIPYNKIFPRGWRGPVTVRIGKPITIAKGTSYDAATELVAAALRGL